MLRAVLRRGSGWRHRPQLSFRHSCTAADHRLLFDDLERWMRRAPDLHLYCHGKPPNAFVNLLRFTERKIQSHVTAALEDIVGIERISRYECNVFGQRRTKQRPAISVLGQCDPEKQPALWMGPCDLGWKEFLKRMKHGVAPLAIYLPDPFHMLIEKSVFCGLISDHLIERRGVQVGSLFEQPESADYFGRRHNPSQANPRRKSFRKGAQVNDICRRKAVVAAQSLIVEHHQRSDVLALIAKLPLGIVFDDWDAILVGQKNQLSPPLL
jgi:hypothetical protein